MSYVYQTDLTFTVTYSRDAEEHQRLMEVRFEVYPGCDATLEQPGERPEVSIFAASIIDNGNRYDAPPWMWRALEGDEELTRELIAFAASEDQGSIDDYADTLRRERQIEGRAQ